MNSDPKLLTVAGRAEQAWFGLIASGTVCVGRGGGCLQAKVWENWGKAGKRGNSSIWTKAATCLPGI